MPSPRDEAQRKIDRKRQEILSLQEQIRTLDGQIREANSYIQALDEMLRLLPKESATPAQNSPPQFTLRSGTTVARIKEILEEAGKPLHISTILKALDRPINNSTRAAVAGSISSYMRKGEIFTRPAPNTFGLIKFDKTQPDANKHPQPPPNFGIEDDDLSDGEEFDENKIPA
jgi:hypothetical protein